MGLGGYLCWTAVAREIVKRSEKNTKVIPVEKRGEYLHIINSEIFSDNKDFCFDPQNFQKVGGDLVPIVLNDPKANYCKTDTPARAFHRADKHIIEQYCESYGIFDPVLRCYLEPDNRKEVENIIREIGSNDYVTIEPYSNNEYTVNRSYPMSHWQKIADNLRKDIAVVQVGEKRSPKLSGVIDLTGRTTFRNTAAIIGGSRLFLSTEGGLVHAATAFDTKSVVVVTGYQSLKMVAYPQNININIAKHGPCGFKIPCSECFEDANNHNYEEILQTVRQHLCL